MKKNITETTDQNITSPQSCWIPLHCAVMGRKHYRQNVPCQDACFAADSPRPYLVACDGRGSASKSHFGANDAVEAIRRQVTISHSLLTELLDKEANEQEEDLLPILKDQFFRAAAVVQKELAESHECSPKDFEFTLIVMILGRYKSFYLHIGDGALVIERKNRAVLLSEPENGDFANVTTFVQYGKDCKSKSALIETAGITGIAAFSDGTGEKMIQAGTGIPSPGFVEIWEGMRKGTFAGKDLLSFLTRTDWEPKVQDDRCLAVLSRKEESHSENRTFKQDSCDKIEVVEVEKKQLKESVIPDSVNKSVVEINDSNSDRLPRENVQREKKEVEIEAHKSNFSLSSANTIAVVILLLIAIFFTQLIILQKIFFLEEIAKHSIEPKILIIEKHQQKNRETHLQQQPKLKETVLPPTGKKKINKKKEF